MKTAFKITAVIIILTFNFGCAQSTIIRKPQEAKSLEGNKSQFIGKPLSYLLSQIALPIQSIIPSPKKNRSEVNRISFLFVTKEYYRYFGGEIKDKPTKIIVIFNQNWSYEGKRCTYDEEGCATWTKQDEKNLGDLIVYDIYVTGNN